jgi:hypothetical protein
VALLGIFQPAFDLTSFSRRRMNSRPAKRAARFIAINDHGNHIYFEISPNGGVIVPPEFADKDPVSPQSPNELALSLAAEPPSLVQGHRGHFPSLLDFPGLGYQEPLGCSVHELLAHPFVSSARLPSGGGSFES